MVSRFETKALWYDSEEGKKVENEKGKAKNKISL